MDAAGREEMGMSERIAAKWVDLMGGPFGPTARTFTFEGADYIVTSGTGEPGDDFVYDALDVEIWLDAYDPKVEPEAYGVFASEVEPVTDVRIARACYAQVGVIPCEPGSCGRVLVEAAGVALVGGDGFVYGVGPDEGGAVRGAQEDGISEQCAAMLLDEDVDEPGEDTSFEDAEAYSRDRRAADAFRFVPCTQRLMDLCDGRAPTRMVPGVAGVDVLDLA
jgi:hypothetical protein